MASLPFVPRLLVVLAAPCILVCAESPNAPPAAPILIGITPDNALWGGSANVTFTGQHFRSEATVLVTGTGVSVSDVVVVNATTLTAFFAVAANAPLGARSVSITTDGGTTATRTFTVFPPSPTLSAMALNPLFAGTTEAAFIQGSNFVAGGTTVAVGGGHVTVTNLVQTGTTRLDFSLVATPGAPVGNYPITVTTAGGSAGGGVWSVPVVAPTLASIVSVFPSSGVQGSTVSVTLTGGQFVQGATSVAVSGTGVTVQNVVVLNQQSLTADFVIAPGATLGARSVTVTTIAGTSDPMGFTVQP